MEKRTEVIRMMMRQYLHEIEDKLKSTANTKEKIASLVRYFSELIKKKPELFRLLPISRPKPYGCRLSGGD